MVVGVSSSLSLLGGAKRLFHKWISPPLRGTSGVLTGCVRSSAEGFLDILVAGFCVIPVHAKVQGGERVTGFIDRNIRIFL